MCQLLPCLGEVAAGRRGSVCESPHSAHRRAHNPRLSGWSGVQTAESLPSRQKTAYAAELGLLVASRLTASDSPRIGTGGFLPFRLPSVGGAAKASFVSAPAIRHRLSTVNHPGPPGQPPVAQRENTEPCRKRSEFRHGRRENREPCRKWSEFRHEMQENTVPRRQVSSVVRK